jgi:hypothetical protein
VKEMGPAKEGLETSPCAPPWPKTMRTVIANLQADGSIKHSDVTHQGTTAITH